MIMLQEQDILSRTSSPPTLGAGFAGAPWDFLEDVVQSGMLRNGNEGIMMSC